MDTDTARQRANDSLLAAIWYRIYTNSMAYFLPRDASAERGYEIAFVCPSVCPSVRNEQVPCSNTLEFFENYFTAE